MTDFDGYVPEVSLIIPYHWQIELFGALKKRGNPVLEIVQRNYIYFFLFFFSLKRVEPEYPMYGMSYLHLFGERESLRPKIGGGRGLAGTYQGHISWYWGHMAWILQRHSTLRRSKLCEMGTIT